MKISDKQLLDAVWHNQLSLLSGGVLHRFIGGGNGVCRDDDFWFWSASSEHVSFIQNITKSIGRQQLRARIRRLIERGHIYSGSRADLCTFMIDDLNARAAFHDARQFWLSQGVPEGSTNGVINSTIINDLEGKTAQCLSMLMDKYGRGKTA
jgi:hypothetical protein